MHPKDKSPTTLSKSPTNNPLQFIKGVGPKLAQLFESRGIHSPRDLLYFFPRAYEDRSQLKKISDVLSLDPESPEFKVKISLAVQILTVKKIPLRGRSLLEAKVKDDSGTLSLKWFYIPKNLEHRLKAGQQLIVTGIPKVYRNSLEIVHPEMSFGVTASTDTLSLSEQGPHLGRLVPIYTEIEHLPTRLLRSILWETTKKYLDSLPDDLPPSLRERHQLPDIQHSIRMIHFPEVPETREKSESPTLSDDLIKNLMDFNTPSHHRLIYEEFLKFEYMILKQRLRLQKENAQAVSLTSAKKTVQHFLNKLPFQLTGDQQLALKDILDDLSQPHPMNRLIQGDVGSGKTVIALLSAAVIYSEGGQTVLMAPTEILAEQHFHNALRLFGTELQIKLLTGKTTANDRKTILAQCASGQPILIIGTHAVIEDPVIFKNLQLIMIDEQHRFGVEQRLKLKQKGYQIDPKTKQSLHPHNIVLTATPIPRTLALTAYGDLDTSIIKEMPPGRTPIRTRVVRGPTRSKAYDFIREQIQKGRQAYFIYPLVSDSEAEGFTHLKSAETDYLRLQKEVFPDLKIGLLHGQMKNQEKVDIMEQFKKGELHILVSTTVIEVGVDVPNATVMAVEHSERFGLSQLHQLRGRVGRGSHQSYCFFFTKESLAEPTAERLDVLEKSTDGFEIAEADLRIRGPGEFLGTKQSGDFPFKIGDLLRDRDWLIKARDDAEWLLRTDPELLLQEHKPLRSYFEQEGKVHFEMLKTS